MKNKMSLWMTLRAQPFLPPMEKEILIRHKLSWALPKGTYDLTSLQGYNKTKCNNKKRNKTNKTPSTKLVPLLTLDLSLFPCYLSESGRNLAFCCC